MVHGSGRWARRLWCWRRSWLLPAGVRRKPSFPTVFVGDNQDPTSLATAAHESQAHINTYLNYGITVGEHRTASPLVDLRTLTMPTVRATNAVTLLLGFGMFGSWMLVPLLVAQPAISGIGFGASPTVVGLVMLPTAAGALLVMPFNGRLSNRRGPRATLMLGTAAAAAAYLAPAVAHGSLLAVCAAVLLTGCGIGLSPPSRPLSSRPYR